MKNIFLLPIQYYKQCINPLLPNTCKFTPSCSAYMMQAISKRGALVGIGMGMWRIMRCNPFTKGGFDPVKNNFKGKAKWLL